MSLRSTHPTSYVHWRLGTTEDIANSVAFLLSDEAAWVTGLVLPTDGGHHLRQGPNLLPQFRQFLPEER